MSEDHTVMIPLDRLILDPDYQPRSDGLSESHLRLLMESDPQRWNPLIVAPNGGGSFIVIDGFHRTEAARRMKLTELRCVIQEDAGYPEAVMANIAHGLPLSVNDRKEAARWWADHEPDMSYREIGLKTALSDKTVKRAIESDPAEAPKAQEASSPLDRWFHQTYRLDTPPSTRDVKAEIDAYDMADRPDVAEIYAAVGRALVDATASYLKRR